MKTRPFLVPAVLFLCLALAAGFALRSRRSEWAIRAATSAARLMQEGLQRELAARVATVETDRARYRALLAAEAVPSPPLASIPAEPSAAVSSATLRQARIGASPALREASAQAYADDKLLLFGGLLKRLGLSAEQLARFEEVQREAQRQTLDRAVFALENRLASNSPELRQRQKEWAGQENDAYREIFGENYGEWVNATANLDPRRVISGIVEATFSGTGSLSGPQADALTALLANHPLQDANGRRGYDWDIILRDAAGFLGPEQLDGFKNGVEMYLARGQMSIIETLARK